jgi:hypothetical protein
VITTAPSDNQVRNILWRDIHAAYAGAKVPLGGKMTTLMWNAKPRPHILERLEPEQRAKWEKNFAIGFSTSPDSVTEHATKLQGFHNEWVLIILDEACGILPQIWATVMESLIVNERCKVLAIGNLTDPFSDFAKACKAESDWNVVRISVLDTPNYKEGREVIPGVAGRAYEQMIAKLHGRHSNKYKYRVLGECAEYREGTYYGKELAQAEKEHRVGNYPPEPTAKVWGFWDFGDMYTAAIFAQFIRGRIRIVDCYWDNQGLGLPAYANAVQSKPYIWAKPHYAGADLVGSNRKSVQTGTTTRDIGAGLGMALDPVIAHSFNDGIEAVRSVWPLLEINKPLSKNFLQAAANYRKKKDEALSTDDNPAYHDQPMKTPDRHMMDALRHMAIAYRFQIVVDGQRIGYPHVIPANVGMGEEDGGDWNTFDSLRGNG